jgi:putative nucleotidyltransferase with HDIG domain
LRDRSVLLRLLICVPALAGLIIAVQAWKAPFPHRFEQRPANGVSARVLFRRVNENLTQRAREKAAERIAPVFRHDAAPLRELPVKLQSNLQQLAQADSAATLPPELRAAFGLAPPAGSTAKPIPDDERDRLFAQLREVVADGEKLQQVVSEWTSFLEPLHRKGLIRPDHLSPEQVAGGMLTVALNPEQSETVVVAETNLAQLLQPLGLLGQRWVMFPALSPMRSAFETWLTSQNLETLTYDNEATQRARSDAVRAVQEIAEEYQPGDMLVKPGELIDQAKLSVLWGEYEQREAGVAVSQRITRVTTVFLMLLVLLVLNGYYLVHNERRLLRNAGRLGIYLALLVVAVALAELLSFDPWRAKIIPLLAASMIIAVAYNQVLAVLTAFSLSLIVTLSTGADLSQFVIHMSVCGTAVILLPGVPTRTTLINVGACAAMTYFVMFWATALLEQPSLMGVWSDSIFWFHALRGAGWCLAAGFLVGGSLPFIEHVFGVVTDISLLELGDVSHPLLQELIRRAPGTYNHSVGVATIGETAADLIGANGLLLRVGAYFHDIGKMLKPHYFVENILAGSENLHENLAPAMSTLIIIGHVKDGVDLSQEHNLPQPLIDLIEQHHGTTLVEYFYHEATRLAEHQVDHEGDAEEAAFRYPGPKPQTREAGVLMLADAVEGASRTLSEPTPKRLERLVHDIAMKRLLDGQFDDCGLTITEIAKIEDSLTKSLISIYHGRVKYPEQQTA